MKAEVIKDFGIEGKRKRFKKGETLEIRKMAVMHNDDWVCDVESPFFNKHLKIITK